MSGEAYSGNVELQHLAPQPVLSVQATIPIAALGEAMNDSLGVLRDYMRQHRIQPAGPPFVRYHTFEETETDLEVGVPVTTPAVGEGRVASSELPSGPALSTWHIGSHDKLGDAYARLQLGLATHNRTPNGAAWEVYHWIDVSQYDGTTAWPDPSTWHTQLVQPIAQ